jgi:large-conductance mechanosensitive channel
MQPTRLLAKEGGNITWNWGNFIQTVINFFIISACVFLLVKGIYVPPHDNGLDTNA